jgi:hypothetical protein
MQKLEGGKKRAQGMENGTQVPTVSSIDEQPEEDSAEESQAVGMAIRNR